MLWSELRIYLKQVWVFDKFENNMNSSENPILTLRILVTNYQDFTTFQYFQDFDIELVLLG